MLLGLLRTDVERDEERISLAQNQVFFSSYMWVKEWAVQHKDEKVKMEQTHKKITQRFKLCSCNCYVLNFYYRKKTKSELLPVFF